MNWTATPIDKKLSGDRMEVTVVLSDGTIKFTQSYATDGTMANLRPQVLATIAAQEGRKVKDDITIGQAINTTPDPIVSPVDPNPARTKWFADYRAYQRDQKIAALPSNLAASFDPSYGDGL